MQVGPLPPALAVDAVALWHQTGLTRPWNDPVADLARALEGPSSTVLAAVSGGALVGTAMVGHDGHRAWLYYLAVAPAWQRRGVGRDLVAACEQWARDAGRRSCKLMVRTSNAGVVAFYARLGYVDAECVVLGKSLVG